MSYINEKGELRKEQIEQQLPAMVNIINDIKNILISNQDREDAVRKIKTLYGSNLKQPATTAGTTLAQLFNIQD